MCFFKKCVLRNKQLPLLPCNCVDCDWYINKEVYNNCFWLLAETLNMHNSFSYTEIADIIGVTLSEVEDTCSCALTKIRHKIAYGLDKEVLRNDS